MNTTLTISSSRVGGPFVEQVERLSSQNLLACYQCGKCSAGCPMSAYMDILPNQMVRMAQLGMKEQLLASRAIWLCVSCLTCNSRCPKNVRIAEIIEAVREVALRNDKRDDNLRVKELSPETLAALPPIATISAMRKLTS